MERGKAILIALDSSFGTLKIVCVQFVKEVYLVQHGFPNLIPVHYVGLGDVDVLLGVAEKEENKL